MLRGGTNSGGSSSSSGSAFLPMSVGSLTLTTMPAALAFLASSTKGTIEYDLTNFTSARVVINLQTVAGPTGSKIIARYISTYSITATDWLDLGTSEISVALDQATNNIYKSAWIPISALAKGDVFLSFMTINGNGASSPTVGTCSLQLK